VALEVGRDANGAVLVIRFEKSAGGNVQPHSVSLALCGSALAGVG
jgi:hypothetical protein